MLTLLVAWSLGQTLTAGPLVTFSPAQGPVGVAMSAGGASVLAVDGGFLVAWGDSRRVNLTPLPAPSRAAADVWLKRVDLGAGVNDEARIICPGPGPASAPRLARSRTTGTTALVWSENRVDAGVTHVTRFDRALALDTRGPCGTLIPSPVLSTPEVAANGSDFVVLMVSLAAVERVDVGQTVSAAQVVTTDVHTNVVAVEGGNTTLIGWRAATGKLMLQRSAQPPLPTVESVTTFDLVGGSNDPWLAWVNDTGFTSVAMPSDVFMPLPASQLARPVGARTSDGGVVVIYGADGGTRLWASSDPPFTRVTPAEVPGAPEGLALRGDEGLALVSHDSATLGGVVVGRDDAGFGFVTSQARLLSEAKVLQRRPSLAWDVLAQAWVVVWEEANSSTSWASRQALVGAAGAVGASSELMMNGEWPRVFTTFDGGVAFCALDGTTTNFLVRSADDDGGVSLATTQVPAVVRSGVLGPQSGFMWSSAPLVHTEYVVLGTNQTPLERTLGGDVTCAAWLGGDFIVTRLGAAGAINVARFADTDRPPLASTSLAGARACVASQPEAGRLGFVSFREAERVLEVWTVDGGSWSVPLDAGVRDLQMSALDDAWLVAWGTDAALSVGRFVEGQRPQVLELDVTPGLFRGVASLSGSTVHRAAVAWPALQGDSLVVRLRTLEVPDGGVAGDAGVDGGGDLRTDAGALIDAGATDAGPAGDAGVSSLDGGTAVWVPVCGCGTFAPFDLTLLALVVLASRRKSARPS